MGSRALPCWRRSTSTPRNFWWQAERWPLRSSGMPPTSWRWQRRPSPRCSVRSGTCGWSDWTVRRPTCALPLPGARLTGTLYRPGCAWGAPSPFTGSCATMYARDERGWKPCWSAPMVQIGALREARPSLVRGGWPGPKATMKRPPLARRRACPLRAREGWETSSATRNCCWGLSRWVSATARRHFPCSKRAAPFPRI